MTGETGPKVSCCTTVISGRTRSSTVGEYSAPLAHVADQQPRALRDRIVDARLEQLRAAASSITVPMSTCGSIGSP